MCSDFRSLLAKYLEGEEPLDAVRRWVADHLGNPPDGVEGLLLDAAMTLWEVDDGYGDEGHFRESVAALLAAELAPTAEGGV